MGCHLQASTLLSLFYWRTLLLAILRHGLYRSLHQRAFSGGNLKIERKRKHTMYGLSLIASLLWASATRRLASATRRTKSSVTPTAGVTDPEGVADPEAGVAEKRALFFMAACLAAISARFCAMSSAPES